MTSKIKQGMHLRQPENSSDGAWIFQTLAAMLACAALMFALAALAGFRTGNLLPILLAAGGYVCIAYGVTIRFQKQQWFFLAALAVLLLLVQDVVDGVGILFVGEDLDVMMALCDKILVLCHGKVMGVVHADKTTKEELGLMMTGALDLTNKYEDKTAGYAKDTNITAQELEELERKKGEEE